MTDLDIQCSAQGNRLTGSHRQRPNGIAAWLRTMLAGATAATFPSPSAAQSPASPPPETERSTPVRIDDSKAIHATPVAEAWWTGPISASSAKTLQRGHVLVEPYLYDVRSSGSDYLGSLTYVLYGLTDRVTVGVIPTFGSTKSRGNRRRGPFATNDLTLTAQYRLNRAAVGAALPTISIVLQHSLPLGQFDKLRGEPDRGIGTGAVATLVGVYAQRVDRLSGGRPLRTRINVTRTLAGRARVEDDSVYGTPPSFVGTAWPGDISVIDLSFEYSLNRRWVLATDFVARWTGSTTVSGRTGQDRLVSFSRKSPSSMSFSSLRPLSTVGRRRGGSWSAFA